MPDDAERELVQIVASGARGEIAAIRRDGELWMERIAAWGLPIAGTMILDVGVGVGRLAVPLAERGAIMVACDENPAMIAYLGREAPHLHLRTGPTLSILAGFEGVRFDWACCCFVLQHNTLVTARRIVRAISRVTDRLLFTYPTCELVAARNQPGMTLADIMETDDGPVEERHKISRMLPEAEVGPLVVGDAFATVRPLDAARGVFLASTP